MLADILRANLRPRGTRAPGPSITDNRDGYGNWWGPNAFDRLPFSSDGSVDPTMIATGGAAEQATLGIPAAWRAVNLIAGTIAQMPISVQEARGVRSEYGSDIRGIGRPLDQQPQMTMNPWPLITYFNWMFSCVTSVVLRGNFYGVKFDYDPATGWPRQILPVHNDDVDIEMRDGYPWYYIHVLNRWFPYSEIFHVRGFMMPGMIQGIGVVEAHRAGLSGIRKLMDFGTGAYASGAVPPVVMTVDKQELSEQEAEYLQSRWVARHGGLDRRPAVVPKIVDVETVGLSMADAEYLQSRQFSIAEIAFMFNLDPEDLSAGFSQAGAGTLRYQNMETRVRDRLIFSLQCWISRIEQVFTQNVPGDNYASFNTDELTRSDALSRFKTYEIALRSHIWVPNEVRSMEGYDPIEGGDVFIDQGSMNPVQDVLGSDDEVITADDRRSIPA